MKLISDELFRAKDSAESAWALRDWATVREGMTDLNGQAELLEALRTELLSLLGGGVLLCDEVAAEWAALEVTIQGVQKRFEAIIPFLEEACRSQPPTLAIMQPQPRALPAPASLISIAHSETDWATPRVGGPVMPRHGHHLSLNIMGVECPWLELAARGNSVLSLAVAAADAGRFLWDMEAVKVNAFDWFPDDQGLRRTKKGRHSVGGGRSLHKETVWNTPTTSSTWLKPATKLRVRAGAFTLHLENVGAAGSAADHGSYKRVREYHGMGEVWRARPGQRWQARLERPFEGEGSHALRQLLQQQGPLKFR